jgi:hypothetical protein
MHLGSWANISWLLMYVLAIPQKRPNQNLELLAIIPNVDDIQGTPTHCGQVKCHLGGDYISVDENVKLFIFDRCG